MLSDSSIVLLASSILLFCIGFLVLFKRADWSFSFCGFRAADIRSARHAKTIRNIKGYSLLSVAFLLGIAGVADEKRQVFILTALSLLLLSEAAIFYLYKKGK